MINNLLIIRATDPNPTPVTFYLPEMVTKFWSARFGCGPDIFPGLNPNLKKHPFFSYKR